MKKLLFITVMIVSASLITAQNNEPTELTNKNGVPILPKAGDFAFGVSTTPLSSSVIALFQTGFRTDDDYPFKDIEFYGKFFRSDNQALRIRTSISHSSINNKNPGGAEIVRETDVYLFMGPERRIGRNRLQGFYGAEFGFGMGGGKRMHTYEDRLSADNTMSRLLEKKDGFRFRLMANLFTGAEYFIAPGVSIGGEIGWGVEILRKSDSSRITEHWLDGKREIEENKFRSAMSSFGFKNFGGGITLKFYFDRDRELQRNMNDMLGLYNKSLKQRNNGIWFLSSGFALFCISVPFYTEWDNTSMGLLFSATGLVVMSAGGIQLSRAKNTRKQIN